MDNTGDIRILSICTGYAGLELALERIFPAACFKVVAVEIESYACANLVAKAEEGKLALEAVYPDVRSLPAAKFRGCFDIVIAGYPCQPFSNAGLQRGRSDPRHLWPVIREILQEVRPQIAIFENVRGHVRLGLLDVLRDLRELGFACECGIFSAAELGASHRRERLFILAHSQQFRQPGRSGRGDNGKRQVCPDIAKGREIRGNPEECRPVMANSDGKGYKSNGSCGQSNPQRRQVQNGQTTGSGEVSEAMAYPDSQRQQTEPAVRPEKYQSDSCGKGQNPLAHTVCDDEREIPSERWQPVIGRQFMFDGDKWPAPPGCEQYWWEKPRVVKSRMGGADDGPGCWVDRIRLLGNGVVPQCGEKAIRYLMTKLELSRKGRLERDISVPENID